MQQQTQVLVTGGAGFIGSHLVPALLQRGHQVRVLDNFATGKRENLSAVANDIELIEGDLRDMDACREACQGVDTVFHLGALGSVSRSVDDPLTSNAVNVQGTLHMLVAAREAGARRLVFSSSSSVYGDTPVLPKQEDMRPLPRSPYAVTKLAAEEYCRAFYRTYSFETVALRYFNVFGPRQDPYSPYAAVIPRFLDALTSGKQPVIYGDGQQSRDFTYVANVVEANILAASAPKAAGEAMNIACGEQLTILDVLNGVAKLLETSAEADLQPPRAGDVRHSRADITAARDLLGYSPLVYFHDGLNQTVSTYLEQHRSANLIQK